jgi:hypothetical protein
MKWTKTKTAIVVGMSVLLAGGIATTAIVANKEKPSAGIPKDWSVIKGSPDQWSCTNGVITGHSTDGESLIVSSKVYRDVTLSAIVGTTNLAGTLAVRMQDADNGYMVLFIPDGIPHLDSRLELFKKLDGKDSVIASYRGRVLSSLGQSAKIGVFVRGSWIEVRLKDVTVLRAKDATFASGFIGLRLFGSTDSPCDTTYSNLTFH